MNLKLAQFALLIHWIFFSEFTLNQIKLKESFFLCFNTQCMPFGHVCQGAFVVQKSQKTCFSPCLPPPSSLAVVFVSVRRWDLREGLFRRAGMRRPLLHHLSHQPENQLRSVHCLPCCLILTARVSFVKYRSTARQAKIVIKLIANKLLKHLIFKHLT